MGIRRIACAALLALLATTAASAQDRSGVVDASVGYAGFVDDATKGYALVAGAFRRYVTQRVSIGPEVVVMWNGDLLRDRNVMVTGNVVFDLAMFDPASPVTPFVLGGVGAFWGRDVVRGGPYWSSDPAFTAGGGVRVRVTRRVAVAVEYRLGWELHQRLSSSISVGLH